MTPNKEGNKKVGLKITSKRPGVPPKLAETNKKPKRPTLASLETIFPDNYTDNDEFLYSKKQSPKQNTILSKPRINTILSKPAKLKNPQVPPVNLQPIIAKDKLQHDPNVINKSKSVVIPPLHKEIKNKPNTLEMINEADDEEYTNPFVGPTEHSLSDIPELQAPNIHSRAGILFNPNTSPENHNIERGKRLNPILANDNIDEDDILPILDLIDKKKYSNLSPDHEYLLKFLELDELDKLSPQLIHTLVKFNLEDAKSEEVQELIKQTDTLISRSQKIAAKGGMLDNLLIAPSNDEDLTGTSKFVQESKTILEELKNKHISKAHKQTKKHHDTSHPYHNMEQIHDQQIIINDNVQYKNENDSFTASYNQDELFKIKTSIKEDKGVKEANVTIIFDPKIIHVDPEDLADSLNNGSSNFELLNMGNEFQDLSWKYLKKMREKGTAFEHRFAEVMCTNKDGEEVPATATLEDMNILLKGAVQAIKIGALPFYSIKNLEIIKSFIDKNTEPDTAESICAKKLNVIIQKVVKPSSGDNPNFEEIYNAISKLPIMKPLTNISEHENKYEDKRNLNVEEHAKKPKNKR